MRYGIPEYRLPKKVLDWEIEGILQLGIDAKTNVEFGADVTLKGLRDDDYDAVFLSVGAWSEHQLNMEGSDAQGVYSGH